MFSTSFHVVMCFDKIESIIQSTKFTLQQGAGIVIYYYLARFCTPILICSSTREVDGSLDPYSYWCLLVPASVSRLVYQRPWCVFLSMKKACEDAYGKTLNTVLCNECK